MALKERTRDWLISGALLVAVAVLAMLGWLNRGRLHAPPDTGEIVPSITLERLSGGDFSLDDQRGKVVLLNLWATWCAPCRQEMPSMQEVYERYREDGLEIVAVALDRWPGVRQPDGRIQGLVSEFVERYGLTFPVLVDPSGDTERLLGVSGLPTTFLIDREGRIRAREVGGRYWNSEPYVEMIQRLLEE